MKKLYIASNQTTNILVSAIDLDTAKKMLNGYCKVNNKTKSDSFVMHSYDGGMLAQGESMMLSAVLY